MKRSTDVPRLPTEVVLEASKLSLPEVRFLVANYYTAQDQRKRADMQIRHLGDKEMPAALQYTADSFARVEQQVQRLMKQFSKSSAVGRWMMSMRGIGPVLSAGFRAHLTMQHMDKLTGEMVPTQTVGHWWSFAGILPDRKWEKGQIRPWNADLKQLTFHAGECFKRAGEGAPPEEGEDEQTQVKKHPLYCKIYKSRKRLLVERNEAGAYAERAKTYRTNSKEVKATLAKGQLPAGNLDRQACNYAVKIFLSHLHAVWYFDHYGAPPPKPFAIARLGHVDEIRVPNAEMFPGFAEAYYGPLAGLQAAE